jgi:hypothetical protein
MAVLKIRCEDGVIRIVQRGRVVREAPIERERCLRDRDKVLLEVRDHKHIAELGRAKNE